MRAKATFANGGGGGSLNSDLLELVSAKTGQAHLTMPLRVWRWRPPLQTSSPQMK
jgi:hypothetical protein